jgi:hypothetical protein
VIKIVADLPSLVAVMVEVPAAMAVAKPLLSMPTTAVLELLQVTTRPVRAPLMESLGVAVNSMSSPILTPVRGAVSVTETMGTRETVMTEVDDFPSEVPVMVAVPGATAVTSPVAETVATAGAELLQVVVLPVSVPPIESSVEEVNCCVCVT